MKIIYNIFLLLILSISFKEEIRVIGYGSSSLFFMEDSLNSELGKAKYINLAKSGEIIETMVALQGANLVSVKFKEDLGLLKSKKYNIEVEQKYKFGNLKPKGIFNVKLENDIYGEINLREGIFRYDGPNRKIDIDENFKINFGFSDLSIKSINIICIGKNNIVSAGYSADQVANYIDLMTKYLFGMLSDQ